MAKRFDKEQNLDYNLYKDIFHTDEFGLFYQCVSSKMYYFKNEKRTGGTHSKVCLTGMVAGNVNGERLPMFVIGKSKTPRCFKGVTNVPFAIGHSRKDGYHLNCLKNGLNKLTALIIDKWPAHPNVRVLDWVELIFLPLNTTSITQPMDRGVIRSLKEKYRSLAVKKQIDAKENEAFKTKNQLPQFLVLTAMLMLVKT